ncbi:TIGR03943 family putative permease subunit [Paenibacillus xerothermodurans]|uniref:TIGR03943 family protein n=1 Tax=Paenibacillus xerothermodurans TaxID=1977292 RepID=A0A2W1N9E3_PAEXE|nr:TIGR03943 family protein [Paenibacillus xerothermodurans]PZE21259.1 TIGR03943 family protein [Paenibacillus xerothermodurans]
MNSRLASLHHCIKAAILFSFAMYIVYLVKTDNIVYYIAPRMTDYVKWSAFGFYLIAVYQVYRGFRAFSGSSEACDCGHDHAPSSSLWKNGAIYGLFCFPLVLGFALPETSLGSSVADKKGMNLSSAGLVKKEGTTAQSPPVKPAPAASAPSPDPNSSSGQSGQTNQSETVASAAELDALFPSDKFTEHYAKYAKQLYQSDIVRVKDEMYIETLTTLDLYQDQFTGKKLELTGFVYRPEDMKDNQFVLGRFSIQCCSADAAPIGLLVAYDRAQNFNADEWVTVTGTIRKTKFNEMDILMLQAEKIATAEPAKTQYVYPNPKFGT